MYKSFLFFILCQTYIINLYSNSPSYYGTVSSLDSNIDINHPDFTKVDLLPSELTIDHGNDPTNWVIITKEQIGVYASGFKQGMTKQCEIIDGELYAVYISTQGTRTPFTYDIIVETPPVPGSIIPVSPSDGETIDFSGQTLLKWEWGNDYCTIDSVTIYLGIEGNFPANTDRIGVNELPEYYVSTFGNQKYLWKIVPDHDLAAYENYPTHTFTTSFTSNYKEYVDACDSYVWPTDGNEYTTSGIYQKFLGENDGFSYYRTLYLTITKSENIVQKIKACNEYTWLTNGQTYVISGLYSETFTSSTGCDSIVNLDLTIGNSHTSATQEITALCQYTWPANGITYKESGTYLTTLVNSVGCDSIIYLDLSINNSCIKIISLSGDLSYGEIQVGTTATSTLTVNNSGNYNLMVTDIELPEGFITNWNSGSIAAGGSCEINITFSPTTNKTYSGIITLNGDHTGGTNTIEVSGTGIVPTRIIELSGDISFGEVIAGSTAASTLTITNSGNTEMTISRFDLPPGFSSDWISGTIGAGESKDVQISFSPTMEQVYGGIASVYGDFTKVINNTFDVSGTGIESTIIMELPEYVSFDSVLVGESATSTFTITNSGNTNMIVTEINLQGAGFLEVSWSGGTIAAGEIQEVEITITSSGTGQFAVLVVIDANHTSGDNSIMVKGSSVEPTVILELSGEMSFGDVKVGQTAMSTLLISNSGNSDMIITGIDIQGTWFETDWTNGTIAAEGSQEVNITFTPTSVETYSGNITVNGNQTSGTNIINVSGTGVELVVAGFTANVTTGTESTSISFSDTSTGNPTAWNWDFDNDGIDDSNEQNPIYKYTEAGQYSVSLTVENGISSDQEIKMNYVTINIITDLKVHQSTELKYYPNPVTNILNVEYNSEMESLRMINMHGNTIYENYRLNEFDGRLQIDVSKYKSGEYIILIANRENTERGKVVIVK